MIRFSKPDITEQDTIDVKKILKSGWLAHGVYTKKLENLLNKNGIESRPFIAGNLLKQPFLKKYNNIGYPNSNFVDSNCFYIGNNQFVNKSRLIKLEKLLRDFF